MPLAAANSTMQRQDSSSSANSAIYGNYHQSTPSSASGTSSIYEARHDPPLHPLNINVPSFSSSRPRPPSTGQVTPLSSRAQPVAPLSSAIPRPVSLESPQKPAGALPPARPVSVDSPRSVHLAPGSAWAGATPTASPVFVPRDLDLFPHGLTPKSTHNETPVKEEYLPQTTYAGHRRRRSSPRQNRSLIPPPRHDEPIPSYPITTQPSVSDHHDHPLGLGIVSESELPPPIMPSAAIQPSAPPNLTLKVDEHLPAPYQEPHSPQDLGKRPKSPGISSFFGWRRGSENQNQSPTTISESRSLSPTPGQAVPPDMVHIGQSPVLGDDEEYFGNGSYYGSNSSVLRGQAGLPHVDELLKELRDVSAELAISIKREMELEDELDKVRADMPTGPMEQTRRTSDYFSDSGASSIKLLAAGSDTKIEGLEKMRRKAEQEKAQIRLELSEKTQEDLNQRRALEMHVHSLEEELNKRDTAGGERSAEHQKELENTRRRLNEERGFKENFEDLFKGLREEIEAYRNERDNLRDEVVPQLRARLEGLESQATEMPTLAYENSRLQQENQSLKNENQTLANARRLQLDMQQGNARFRSISEEEEDDSFPGSPGLGRSNSLVRNRSLRNRSNSLNKPKDGMAAGEVHADSFKALEDQRDALQRTLKNLIIRQESMARNHSKHVRSLEAERDRALSTTQRRATFKFEVQNLRSDINHLRRRADDALERKWQCEKGLSGLSMDLDRAQQETSSLRELLRAKDIFNSDRSSPSSNNSPAASEPLSSTYDNLCVAHSKAIAQLQSRVRSQDDAEAEDLIRFSESRMRDLSRDIETQLTFNDELRRRLQDAVNRGVLEQQTAAQKIVDLETSLRTAEEQLVSATNISEVAISKHEDYVKTMRDAADEQSRRGVSRIPVASKRLSAASLTPRDLPSTNSKIALFTARTPRIATGRSGKAAGIAGDTQVDTLQKRIRELEEAAARADREMQQAVEQMNRAQVEVADLQTQRDEATKKTSHLQRQVVEERERAKALTT